jgi:hypothetical protein
MMNNEKKKKVLLLTIILFSLSIVVWYGNVSTPPQMTDMPNVLRIRDGQTVVYNLVRIEYLYKYVMPDNSTRNVLMINGYGATYPYEVDEGGYVNLFQRYQVTMVNNQFVLMTRVS